MTIAIFKLHENAAAQCQKAALEAQQPRVPDFMVSVVSLVRARLFSASALAKSTYDLFFVSGRRIVKIGLIPPDEGESDVVVRMVVTCVLLVSLTALRVFISFGGVITPEAVFGACKAHRFLLRLGLVHRAQFANLNRTDSQLDDFLPLLDAQRWRERAVTKAISMIDQEEQDHRPCSNTRFRTRVWVPSLEAAFQEELGFVTADFFQNVVVSHPLLENFQQKLLDNLPCEAKALYQQKLYTKEEIEDMTTALAAVFHRAIAKTIEQSFVVSEEKIPLRRDKPVTLTNVTVEGGLGYVLVDGVQENGEQVTIRKDRLVNERYMCQVAKSAPVGQMTHQERRLLRDGEEIVVHEIALDGKKLLGKEAGGLEEWKEKLIEIHLLIKGLSAEHKALLPYYLCADLERVHRVFSDDSKLKDLPDPSAYLPIKRCFTLIGDFYTTFVLHHMGSDGAALQKAFTIPVD